MTRWGLTHRPPAATSAFALAVAGHLLLISLLMLALPAPRPPTVHSDRVLQLMSLGAAPAVPEPTAVRTPTPSAVIDRMSAPWATVSAVTDTAAAPRAAPSAPRPTSHRPGGAVRSVAVSLEHPVAVDETVAVAPDPPTNPTASGDEAEARARAADATREPETDEGRLREDLQRRIRHDFTRHFRYPPLARRHGWEGAVRLRYDVTPQGRVINVRLLASSGHPVLDRDAEQTLSGLPPLAAAAWAEPVEALELAVHYRLTEG
ncbi:MAG TPA: energy transducer TonB [Candidatus Acidoferrales bacterium]|nr:energy transducer TonB [Candidatus Acidoferrales bacterium]